MQRAESLKFSLSNTDQQTCFFRRIFLQTRTYSLITTPFQLVDLHCTVHPSIRQAASRQLHLAKREIRLLFCRPTIFRRSPIAAGRLRKKTMCNQVPNNPLQVLHQLSQNYYYHHFYFYYYIVHLYSPSNIKIISNALDACSNGTELQRQITQTR